MKRLLLLSTVALLSTGLVFANDGKEKNKKAACAKKECCKDKKECTNKESKDCCKKEVKEEKKPAAKKAPVKA